MHYGRDVKPDGTNYTPLSLQSNLCACPLHSESVGGTSFQFPPDEMPTHAARCALDRGHPDGPESEPEHLRSEPNGLGVDRHV